MTDKQKLQKQAREIWQRYRNGGRPSMSEASAMRLAYWSSCLPKDPDYSVAQWVEDGFPQLP